MVTQSFGTREDFKRDAQFAERNADKIALCRARMRQGEFWIVQAKSAKVDEIEVDRARSVPHGANTSKQILDRMHALREVVDIKCRLQDNDLVEKLQLGELRRHVNGLRLENSTLGRHARVGQGIESLSGLRQIVFARREIAPKGDNHAYAFPVFFLRLFHYRHYRTQV